MPLTFSCFFAVARAVRSSLCWAETAFASSPPSSSAARSADWIRETDVAANNRNRPSCHGLVHGRLRTGGECAPSAFFSARAPFSCPRSARSATWVPQGNVDTG